MLRDKGPGFARASRVWGLSALRAGGRVSLLLLALAVALAVTGCADSVVVATPLKREIYALGTIVTITAYGPEAERALDLAANEFRSVERTMSRFAPDSEVAEINRQAGSREVEVSPATLEVLGLALRYGDLSGGALDVTVTPLMEAWGFGGDEHEEVARLPSEAELEEARALVDYRRVEVRADGKVFLPEAGMALDLGAVAKGYAVERAAATLREAGVRGALINAGGTVKGIGNRPDGRPWRVGLQDPLRPEEVMNIISLADGEAVVTSGDYQRFIEVDGRRYSHIIDPATGYPAERLASVTIVGGDAFVADALSTAVFVMGFEDGARLLSAERGTEMVAVTKDGQKLTTGGLGARLETVP